MGEFSSSSAHRSPAETALGTQGAPAGANESQRCLEALDGRPADPALARRVDRVVDSIYGDGAPLTPEKRNEAKRRMSGLFREFLTTLKSEIGDARADQSRLALEAYQVSANQRIPAKDVAAFLKALPPTANFGPYDAAVCLMDGVAARDVARALPLFQGRDGPPDAADAVRMVRELCGLPGFSSLADACAPAKGRAPLRVQIGKTVADPSVSPNLLRGLLVFARQSGETPTDAEGWRKIAERYGQNVDDFLKSDRAPRAVFFLGARPQEDPEGSFEDTSRLLRKGIKSCAPKAEFHDVSQGGVASLLEQAGAYVRANPKKPLLINVALHGLPDGTARHAQGDLTPDDFRKLAALGANVTVQVDGCYAGTALPDAGPGTLLLGSSLSQAWPSFQEEMAAAFADPASDLDGDGKVGWREARLAVFLRWRKSFLPTSFTPRDKAPVRLAATEGSADAPQA